jgi:hypothetical protein
MLEIRCQGKYLLGREIKNSGNKEDFLTRNFVRGKQDI